MKANVDVGERVARSSKRLKELCQLCREIDERMSVQNHPDRNVPRFAAAEFARYTMLAHLADVDRTAARSDGSFALMDEIITALERSLFESLEPAAMYGVKIAAAHFVRDAFAHVTGGRQPMRLTLM